jgi:hypothetical protein
MRQEATVIVFVILILACALALGLGLALVGGREVSPEYRKAMESLHLDTATKMGWIKVLFWGGLAALSLVGVGGLVAGLLRAVWRRSRLVHPHPSGIFPVVEGRAGGQTYYHDPNRQLAGTVAYGGGPEGVAVRHLVPPGQEEAQFQVATQAQATQLVAAASQGQGTAARTGRLVERRAVAAPMRPVPRLPEVVVLDEAIPEERHLLTALRQDWEEGG